MTFGEIISLHHTGAATVKVYTQPSPATEKVSVLAPFCMILTSGSVEAFPSP